MLRSFAVPPLPHAASVLPACDEATLAEPGSGQQIVERRCREDAAQPAIDLVRARVPDALDHGGLHGAKALFDLHEQRPLCALLPPFLAPFLAPLLEPLLAPLLEPLLEPLLAPFFDELLGDGHVLLLA